MSFFKDVANIVTKGGDVVTFSAVEGVVTYEGKPVANAKIIRRVEDKDNNSEDDFATTDEKGYFSMPSRYGNSDSVFQEVFAWQYMYVELEGEQKEIWYHVKHVKDEHGELEGTPIAKGYIQDDGSVRSEIRLNVSKTNILRPGIKKDDVVDSFSIDEDELLFEANNYQAYF